MISAVVFTSDLIPHTRAAPRAACTAPPTSCTTVPMHMHWGRKEDDNPPTLLCMEKGTSGMKPHTTNALEGNPPKSQILHREIHLL